MESSLSGPAGSLQAVLGPAQEGPLVAGLPAVLRAAQRIAEDLPVDRIILRQAPPGFARRWSRQLDGCNGTRVDCADNGGGPSREGRDPLLEVCGRGLPRSGALARFLDEARAADGPARWVRQGEVLAVYHPAGSGPGGREARDFEAGAADWLAFDEPDAVPRAEAELFASLAKDTDGYIARFDRRISVALSRWLLRTPVTPNHITTASLALGLLGAALLGFGSYPLQLSGAVILWFCCILDGCDGEVARLKMLCSRSGADYDLGADHLTHLAIFVAIPFGVRAADPQARVLLPGALMVSGLAASMLTVWWTILRRPAQSLGRARLFFERVASRDYVYLILALVAVRRLHWFLWAAAFGAHCFNLAIWWLFLRYPDAAEPAPAS